MTLKNFCIQYSISPSGYCWWQGASVFESYEELLHIRKQKSRCSVYKWPVFVWVSVCSVAGALGWGVRCTAVGRIAGSASPHQLQLLPAKSTLFSSEVIVLFPCVCALFCDCHYFFVISMYIYKKNSKKPRPRLKINIHTYLTLTCLLAAEYDLSDSKVSYKKRFIKVTYVGFLHNHSYIYWKPNRFFIKAISKGVPEMWGSKK